MRAKIISLNPAHVNLYPENDEEVMIIREMFCAKTEICGSVYENGQYTSLMFRLERRKEDAQ